MTRKGHTSPPLELLKRYTHVCAGSVMLSFFKRCGKLTIIGTEVK